MLDTLKKLKTYDDERPGLPGEHWLVLGAGILLLIYATRPHSPLVRSLATTAGTGLIARAASGRDGLRALRERRAADVRHRLPGAMREVSVDDAA